MIPFGIIGTNWITHDYITHAQSTGKWTLASVYSRKASTATEFAAKYASQSVATFTDLNAFVSDPNISTVYIASPNSLHYEHTKLALNAGKHVILEKPSVCTSQQLDQIFKLAYEKGLILIEAYRHVHEVNFKILKKALGDLGPLYGASITYAQFSSRYDAVLAGEKPNIFTLEMGGGALADLGVYVVCAAVELFGEPREAEYFPQVLEQTGADGGGTLVLRYEGFMVTLLASKMFHSVAPSEFYGLKGTLVVPTITDIESVTLWDPRKKEGREIGEKKAELNLSEEAADYARIIEEKDVEEMKRWEKVSRGVLKVTEKVRRDNGLLYPVERE
ncbi:NAD(P)-binding protein [Amniculicola lignicola CBS 123094]|uniref:NAD(P)-binding protein n=1 Tax=Amniculicola lignicola CBS 123094 TaxID=1392246 RepID=A0A6A5WUQ8_9PLEO|nr:NAD(P)-binding protein [Amniculicola lignicola CBS 123094]